MQNALVWAKGQKLFAGSTLIIGVVFMALGSLHISEKIPGFLPIILLIGLWNVSKYFINKTLGEQ